MLYMVTFTINIPQMLAYIPAPWILWDIYIYISRYIRKRFPLPIGYFQQLPSELLEVHLNVCHGLLRSTALRCGEARAVASIGIHRAAAQDLVVFPAESMGFTWIQWGVYIDVPGWWFQPCFIFHNI